MAKPVKKTSKKRPYASAVRKEQAALTRRRILDAAGELFVANGYGPTTIRQIAEAAGVAPDTVYATFGTKTSVLLGVIDLRLAPQGAVNINDQPEVQAVREETDQRQQIRLYARFIAEVSQRVRPVVEVLRTAYAVDPEMADVYADQQRYRLANQRQIAEWLAANGPLRVDVQQAAETIWALASPDVARQLCDGQGWTTEEFAEWLADTLERTLLPDLARRRARVSR
jgi:AcrR family transcriptional regulator